MPFSTVNELKKPCLFVSIEIISTWGVWVFNVKHENSETCSVFNEMIQFKYHTDLSYFYLRNDILKSPTNKILSYEER